MQQRDSQARRADLPRVVYFNTVLRFDARKIKQAGWFSEANPPGLCVRLGEIQSHDASTSVPSESS